MIARRLSMLILALPPSGAMITAIHLSGTAQQNRTTFNIKIIYKYILLNYEKRKIIEHEIFHVCLAALNLFHTRFKATQ